MKTKQTKIDRSAAKLLPGAMTLAAATAGAQAATVQITLTGNQISLSGNQLAADLTGDSVADISITDPLVSRTDFGNHGVFANINSGLISAQSFITASTVRIDAQFATGGIGTAVVDGAWSGATTTYLNPISFTDSRINGGGTTQGFLEVSSSIDSNSAQITLTRLIFDDASTTRPTFAAIPGTQTEWGVSAVPEPTTNLALLALGAGGLTLRRRQKAKAA